MKRSKIFRVIALLLLTALFAFLAGCESKDKKTEDARNAEKIVEEIAVDYGTYGDEASDKIGSLL